MRLIDADALENLLQKDGHETLVHYIHLQPTIDAVPVVRCKDCKHYNTIGCSKGFGWCENIDRGTSDNFYCANGKQLNKESEE